MPKLTSLSLHTQAKLICYRRAEKPQPLGYPLICRKISRELPLPTSCRRAKRPRRLHDPCILCHDELGSQIPSRESPLPSSCRRAKRPRRLHDPSILYGDDLGSQIPFLWGAKRARSTVTPVRIWKAVSILGDDDLLRYCSSQIPIWGTAKRARSAPDWRDWTNLGDGPAGLIAERLLANDVADYICFRAVCRLWRHCCTDPREHGILDRRFHPRQWIMFGRNGGSPNGGSPDGRGFINVSTGCLRYVDLPEIHGHDVFGPTTEGLLVLLDRTTYVVRLLNPFTHQAANFPPATAQLSNNGLEQEADLKNEVLNVSGAGLADQSTLAVLFGGIKTVAVAKPGDAYWTVVHRGTWLLPALSFAGRFYCSSTSEVMVVETSADHPPRLAIAAKLTRPISMMMMDSVHLMDIGGKLMLVDRQSNGSRQRREFTVYRIDLDAKKMVPVHGLGGHAVFIGRERSMSVSPLVFSSISADTIYLGFDRLLTGTMDYSPIHLMDGTSVPRNIVKDIDGMPIYQPQRVDEYLSWCVTAHYD